MQSIQCLDKRKDFWQMTIIITVSFLVKWNPAVDYYKIKPGEIMTGEKWQNLKAEHAAQKHNWKQI